MSIPEWWGTPVEKLQGIQIDDLIPFNLMTPVPELLKQDPLTCRELRLLLQDIQGDSHQSADCNLPVSPDGSAQATFPRFRDLSIEIRTMIWKYALPESRVVDLIYDKNQDRYFSFNSPPPALLHAVSH